MRAFASLLILLTVGCATAPTTTPAGLASRPATVPTLTIEQLPSSDLVVEQKGAVSIAYQMTVRNPTPDTIRLTKVTMKTLGRSPYLLRSEDVPFNETIEAGKEAVVAFSMWGVPRVKGSPGRTEKVWVQGTATFEGPSGTFQQPFSQSFNEPK